MTVTAAAACDLLFPFVATLEGRFEAPIEGDLEVDPDGNLWLTMLGRGRQAKVHVASPKEIESGAYKNLYAVKLTTAFDVFDQATRDTA